MALKISIEWSEIFENEILELARQTDPYLALEQAIIMYVEVEMNGEAMSLSTRPAYIDRLTDNKLFTTVKDKLIHNLGKFDMLEMLHKRSNKPLFVVIGKVSIGDLSAPKGQMMEAIYKMLIHQHNPVFNDEPEVAQVKKS